LKTGGSVNYASGGSTGPPMHTGAQKMKSARNPAKSFYIVAVLWGLFGGLSVVAAEAFSTPRIRAGMIVLAYAAVVIGSSIAVRHADSRGRRFLLGFGAFMLATAVMYGYIIAVVNPAALGFPFWEHAWRFGFMAALGIIATAIPLTLLSSIERFGGGKALHVPRSGSIRLTGAGIPIRPEITPCRPKRLSRTTDGW
jgi:hypothetical protein